jgi:hypothetical protein
MPPPTRYARRGAISIAYQAFGEAGAQRKLVGRVNHSLGAISYHFRVLHEKMRLIEIDDERRLRGAVEHVYRLTAKGRGVADDVASVVARTVEERIAA